MDPSDRVEQLQNETLEEEETSSTITKELQFLISLREEDNQQEDATFDLINKCFRSVFTFNLNLNLSNINTIQEPPTEENIWECFQKHYRNEHKKNTGQHGLAVIFLEGYEKAIYVPKPAYPTKDNPDGTHVEEILIKEIHEFLQQNENDKGPKVKFIMIYTYNSPCLKRKKPHISGCMFQLLVMAWELDRKYDIFTYVLFTEYWGTIGERSPILRDLSDLHKQHHITFRLDSTKIIENLNKIKEKQLLSMFEYDFRKAKAQLIELSKSDEALTTEQHLVRGKEVIAFLEDQEKIYNSLLKSFQDGVENSFKKHFTAVCNTVQVKCFIENLSSILENSNPIKFYQIPQSFM
ncbi:hypothetical protein INR49_024345 [Caranx melampygus]|nr:hypothetical protein INR49_024345 [Caranx melampygus]